MLVLGVNKEHKKIILIDESDNTDISLDLITANDHSILFQVNLTNGKYSSHNLFLPLHNHYKFFKNVQSEIHYFGKVKSYYNIGFDFDCSIKIYRESIYNSIMEEKNDRQ
jgi:hypothetical protein